MSTPSARPDRTVVEDVGDVSIVGFVDKKILGDEQIQEIGDDLYRLVDELGCRKVLLEFSRVEFMSTAVLGKFVTLLRKLQIVRGKFVLCAISRDIMELFQLTKLDRIFTVITHPDLATPTDALREVFGYPERPVTFSPDWRTDTVLTLAKQILDSREFSVMPILADAIEDAGCTNDDLLSHLRNVEQPHVRECWVLDLVLGQPGPRK